MPLYMDQHNTAGASPEDLARAHFADLAVQEEYGVRFLTYWLDYQGGVANCLVDASDPEAVNRAHAAAHGNLAGKVIPVEKDDVLAFLGRTGDTGGTIDEPATRTIVFTDMVDSTAQLDALGDEAAMASLREHNRIVRDVLTGHRGRVVKSTGDGFMLVFDSPLGCGQVHDPVATGARRPCGRRPGECDSCSDRHQRRRAGKRRRGPLRDGRQRGGAAVRSGGSRRGVRVGGSRWAHYGQRVLVL